MLPNDRSKESRGSLRKHGYYGDFEFSSANYLLIVFLVIRINRMLGVLVGGFGTVKHVATLNLFVITIASEHDLEIQ